VLLYTDVLYTDATLLQAGGRQGLLPAGWSWRKWRS